MLKCKMMFVCVFIVLVGNWANCANNLNSEAREKYFKLAIEGKVPLQTSTNGVLRDCVTNAFNALEAKGYHLRSSSVSKIKYLKNMVVKTLEWDTGDGDLSQRFSVSMVESRNDHDEAMNGLAHLMSSSSNAGGSRFKHFKQGPGDVCFVNKGADPEGDALGINVLFFCRDNIAVMVIPYSLKSNILSFARLLDSSLMVLPLMDGRADVK